MINLLFHYAFGEIPFWSDYMSNTMIERNKCHYSQKEGIADIDHQFTGVLFKVDYNHNNKYLDREFTYIFPTEVDKMKSRTTTYLKS